MDLSNKKIFITGGSAGIGKALINELASQGVTEIAVMGRRVEPIHNLIKEFPSVNFLAIQGNVGDASDIEYAIQKIKVQWGAMDILINNAGVVSAAYLEELSDEDIINQVSINLTGLILLTKRALPLLKKSTEGAIINVSSGLGYIAMPFYNVYAATKAGVRQFSDAMRRELHNFPIHVMTIYPTATDTPMMKNAVVSKMDSPEDVARKTIDGLLNGEINVVFGGEQRLNEIDINHSDPKKMDELAKERFEALRERTLHHRSM